MTVAQAIEPLHTFFMIVSFVLGAMVGSFCNVCICRWPAGESVVSPRSRCPKCKNAIAWYDNFPIISWLLLGAKCRHCGLPISWQYPLVEAITGVLFLCVYWRFGFVIATPVYMALSAALVIVAFQDLADWTIPNEITLPGIIAGLAVALLGMTTTNSMLRVINPMDALDGIALGCFVICLMDSVVVLLLKKPGMGFGDVKLLAMLGAFFGWRGVFASLLIASFTGGFIGILLILIFRAKQGEEEPEKPKTPTHPPVDPLSNIVLGASAAYLFVRILFFAQTKDPIIEELYWYIVSGAGCIALFAWIIVLLSWNIYTQQQKHKRRTTHTGDEIQESGEDEFITIEGHYLPFGPYLALSGLLFMFFEPELIGLYSRLLHAPPPMPGMLP